MKKYEKICDTLRHTRKSVPILKLLFSRQSVRVKFDIFWENLL